LFITNYVKVDNKFKVLSVKSTKTDLRHMRFSTAIIAASIASAHWLCHHIWLARTIAPSLIRGALTSTAMKAICEIAKATQRRRPEPQSRLQQALWLAHCLVAYWLPQQEKTTAVQAPPGWVQ
jgi:hypothetical protein